MSSGESYAYDDASNLTSKTVGSLTTTYTFDNANQLTGESNSGYSASYTYDANGNRSGSTINGTTSVYNVDDGDKLNSITVSGTTVKSYGYDAAGRTTSVVTSAGTTSLSYDYENRITGITYPSTATNSFSYNGLDTRVSKVDSTGTYTYLRDGADVTDPILSDGAAAYTPGVSQSRTGTTTYDLNDFLGSATRQTSTSASTTATRTYDAWGNLLSTTGTPLGPFGFVGGLGYQEDGDSGLKLLGHRYYDPSTGRFLTRDPAKEGRNWFIYCDDNPTCRTDRSGLDAMAIGGALILVDPEPIGKTIGIGIIVVFGIADIVGAVILYRRIAPGKEHKHKTPHYPVGPHVDMDPSGHKGGPHIDFPDPANPGRNLPPENLGPPGWDPVRDPHTGKMIPFPMSSGIPGPNGNIYP